MKVYDEDYIYIEKEKLSKIRLEEKKEYLEMKKQRNKTYLKGQCGVRLYYDYDKRYKNEFGDYVDYDGDDPEEENLDDEITELEQKLEEKRKEKEQRKRKQKDFEM